MRILIQDFRSRTVKIQIDDADDLWHLSTIIEPEDVISGSTWRKVKTGKEDERSRQAARKRMFLAVRVEKVEFGSGNLRALGVIPDGPDDVPRGEHHSFSLEQGTTISITKPEWLSFHVNRLQEAAKQKRPSVLICILDREDAYFALLKHSGYEILSSLRGEVAKKADEMRSRIKESRLYPEVIRILQGYSAKYSLAHIILASPVFWKEELLKTLDDPVLKKKITLAACSSADERAFDEVIRRPEVQAVLKDERAAKELRFAEELFAEIAVDGLYAYGIAECEDAAARGAVKMLLVTDACIARSREKGEYPRLDEVMKASERTKAEVHLISSENDAGKRLDGIGGIGAVLRYRMG